MSRLRVSSRTEAAVYYVGNEVMRGLIEIISRSGLSVDDYLLPNKEDYVKAISFWLKEQTLNGIELKIIDGYDDVIERWIFEVRYESDGSGIIEFPVENVIRELKDYSMYGISYKIILIVNKSASDLPSWVTSDIDKPTSSRYISSFGYSPIGVDIKRSYQ